MILVDTSIWIDYFRGNISSKTEELDRLLQKGEPAITGLIQLELLQGTRNISERKILDLILKPLIKYFEPPEIWLKAASLAQQVKSKGFNIKTVDLVIASMAIHYDLPLFASDSDFTWVARHSKLNLYG